MSQDVILVNGYYPIGYFADNVVSLFSPQEPTEFWASTEELPPSSETLTFNFGRIRPINFLDFEISSKPIDISIEYDDGTGKFVEVNYNPNFTSQTSVQYLPSSANPWRYTEHHFALVQTQFVRITFTRREDPFPLRDSELFPWSIETRNARFMHLIQTADDFVSDAGTDLLGNSFRTDIANYPAGNSIDDDDSTYWMSQPNPTKFAVESLYFDLRVTAVPGTMGFLDIWNNTALDTRSMADMELYLENGVVVDEIYIDPITFGPTMHIYYSMDDTPDWDEKLWIPINRSYILKKGFHALPSSTFVKYMKLEFSNLAAIPYNTQEYPTLLPVTYRKFPTWVQNYFEGVGIVSPNQSDFINPVDRVNVDPLQLGFRREEDILDSGLGTRTEPTIASTDQEITDFLAGTSALTKTAGSQQATESQIQFNSPRMYQRDLITELDTSRALTRVAIKGESAWNAEILPTVEPVPTVQSTPDLSKARQEKIAPTMYFPYTCRHFYQIVQGQRSNKIAYQVGVRDVKFIRRDYTATHDEEFYIEMFDDDTHFGEVNDFSQDDWRYTIEP